MLSTAPCLRCGELIAVDHEVEAGVAICEACLKVPAARRAAVRVDAPSPILALSHCDGQERIVTRSMLVPLMYDADLDVAKAAIESAGTLGAGDFLFVPPLVSLMRNRRLKSAARTVLVGYGEPVIAPLAYFMADADEDIWVRRHVPGTLAHIASPSSVAALMTALDDPDGFLRYKAIMALLTRRSDVSHELNWIQIGSMAGPSARASDCPKAISPALEAA